MTFEEWCAKKGFFDDVGSSYIQAMRMAWKAAQEDMRERAADVCKTRSEVTGENIVFHAAIELENKIRALPIEV